MRIFKKSEEGIALPTAIIIMLICFTLSAIVLSTADSIVKSEVMYESNTQALHAAEAGIHMYLWSINKEGASVDLDTIVTYPDTNPEYAFILHEDLNNSGRKEVRSTGWAIHNPNIKQTVSAVMTKRSFTEHVYFTDREDSGIFWQTGEKCYGPYRSNTSLYISGSPIFYGMVYYANTIEPAVNSAVFMKGHFKDGPMNLPNSNSQLMTLAKTDGYYIEGRTSIMMNPDGTMTIWNPRGKNPENNSNPYTCNIPPNGVIYVNKFNNSVSGRFNENEGNVFISGKLNGRLTVASSNDIYITDYNPTIYNFNNVGTQTNGVTYANLDFTFNSGTDEFDQTSSSDDMLGLIATKNIALLTYGWFNSNTRVSSHGNIKVHAAVMALEGSFINYNYTSYPYNNSNPSNRGYIELRGALIQAKRGAVGYGNYGYAKDYAHDTRMMTDQPPHFLEPEQSGWEIISWR